LAGSEAIRLCPEQGELFSNTENRPLPPHRVCEAVERPLDSRGRIVAILLVLYHERLSECRVLLEMVNEFRNVEITVAGDDLCLLVDEVFNVDSVNALA